MLTFNSDRVARLSYTANGFRVLKPGDYVLCGVTGEAIMLDALRYWSVERQQAFASARVATGAMRP